MKVLDFTPLRKPDGSFEPLDRIKATLQFGPSWFALLEGQDHVVALLERNLGSGYTLLRNFTLPGADLMFPLILVGPAGVFIINVANERGLFRAKGEEWSVIQGERAVPVRINPLRRTLQFAAVLQKYLEKQGFPQVKVEGALLAANPGLQVESVRPAARVVMFDALDRFAISVAQTPPSLPPALVQQIVTRIQNPLSPQKEAPPAAPPAPPSSPPQSATQNQPALEDDRLSLGFAEDQPVVQAVSSEPHPVAPRPVRRTAPRKKAKKRAGLSTRQLAILGGIFLFWVCLLVGFIVWAVINAF